MKKCDILPALLCAGFLGTAVADEGMWPFDQVPREAIRQRHGVDITPQLLARLQAAAVHLGGASASFVSADGLVLTNHHVVQGCVARLSSAAQDLAATGFVAATPAEEKRCPGLGARVLLRTEDVTDRVAAAAAGADDDDDAARQAARKAEIARMEDACSDDARGQRCEVVALYGGARLQLYHYRSWDDVRLVWVPERAAGSFGGDPDNFVYPRHALDAALVRVVERDGRPHRPAQHLRPATRGLRESELLFVAGHPASTERLLTAAQLEAAREVELPLALDTARAAIDGLHAYAAGSPEAARQAAAWIDGTENWFKSTQGEFLALQDAALRAAHRQAEQSLREAYRRRGLPGDPWADVERVVALQRTLAPQLWGTNFGYRTALAAAGDLVALVHERGLPEARRLAGFADAALHEREERLLADTGAFYPALETVRQAVVLQRSLELLGPDHPFVRRALAGRSPRQAAEALVQGSRLVERGERERLLRGGAEAIAASTDPLVVLARETWPMRRHLLLRQENEIAAPLQRAAEAIDRARYAVHGNRLPPDATGTLRLSYGPALGYVSHGLTHPWKTTWGGWWARADAFDQRPPFDLPARIDRARGTVDPRTPLNFVLTADIVGGNSGSPVVDSGGDLVGLIFDSNLEGLGATYAYQDHTARAIAVHVDAILAALEQVYGARHLVREMRGP